MREGLAFIGSQSGQEQVAAHAQARTLNCVHLAFEILEKPIKISHSAAAAFVEQVKSVNEFLEKLANRVVRLKVGFHGLLLYADECTSICDLRHHCLTSAARNVWSGRPSCLLPGFRVCCRPFALRSWILATGFLVVLLTLLLLVLAPRER